MTRLTLLLLAALLIAAAGSPVETKSDRAAVLGLPLLAVPKLDKQVPLSTALSEIGSYVTDGYVLFGVEVYLRDGKEPRVDLDLQPGQRSGDALRQALRQLPDYEFKIVSGHLIDVYPRGAIHNPDDVLNLYVRSFDVTDEFPDNIIDDLPDFIPELQRRLTLRTGAPPPPVQPNPIRMFGIGPVEPVHVWNASVRDILNAASQATEKYPAEHRPAGWLYTFQPDPSAPGGGVHSFRVLSCAPTNWRQQKQGEKKLP